MYLTRILGSFSLQFLIAFNLDIYCTLCVKLIHFHKNFHLNYVFKVGNFLKH